MNKTVIFSLIICLCLLPSLVIGNPAKAPSTSKLDSLTDRYEPVIFNHEKHAALAGNCGTCHHQHEANSELSCKNCHSIPPSMFKDTVVNNFLSCKSCHGAYDRSNPRMPGLKTAYHQACFKCHRGMDRVGTDPKGCAGMCHGERQKKI